MEGDKTIPLEVIDGVRVVELDWFNGVKKYKYDIIPVVCFFKIKIPANLYDRIELIYEDGDKDNLLIENLSYRFTDGPLESELFKGFYYIPYYTDFIINASYDVISLRLYKHKGVLKHKRWTVSKPIPEKNITGGYYCGRGNRDYDGASGATRHRFIALAFIPYTSDPTKLVVNHKNGIPGCDSVSNLEWVTYSQNTKHAYDHGLHSNKTVAIVYLNEREGVEKRYNTVSACVKETGFTFGFINGRLKNQTVYYTDGIRFKFDDGLPWAEKITERISPMEKAVFARNVFTNEITIYASVATASFKTGTKTATVRWHCNFLVKQPVSGYNFRYVSDDVLWPEHTEYHLRMYKRFTHYLIPDGVFLLDGENNIARFYECFSDLAVEVGISEQQLRKMAKQNMPLNGLFIRVFDVKGTL